jgi:hypothetical protein
VKLAAVVLLLPLFLSTQAVSAPAQGNVNPTPKTPNQNQNTTPIKPVAPSPDEGTVNGNRYTSHYFAFTYVFPEQFEVMEDLMEGQEDAAKQAFVLLAAYAPPAAGENRQGVVIFADRLEQDSGGSDWALKYFENLGKLVATRGAHLIVANHKYLFAGKKFLRADLHRDGEGEGLQAILVTLDRGYALGFQFVASTEKQIDSMIESLNTLRFAPKNAPTRAPGRPN